MVYSKWIYTRRAIDTILLEKYPTLVFLLRKPSGIHEARFHKANLNLHMHTWIFSRLSETSVDDKKHFTEVVFSALVGFSL